MERNPRAPRYIALSLTQFTGCKMLDVETFEDADELCESSDNWSADYFEVTQGEDGRFILSPVNQYDRDEMRREWEREQRNARSDFEEHNTHWGLK